MYTRFKTKAKNYKIGIREMAAEQILAIFTPMIHIHHKQSLRKFNSFGLNSTVSYYARPGDLETLEAILENDLTRQLPLLVLGEGSNILFRNNFEGLIIQPGMKGIE